MQSTKIESQRNRKSENRNKQMTENMIAWLYYMM